MIIDSVERLTPVKAIRKYCIVECCQNQLKEVRQCTADQCSLKPYRLGKRKVTPKPVKTPVKAIRAKCLDCHGMSRKKVRNCDLRACPLFLYRMGRRPKDWCENLS